MLRVVLTESCKLSNAAVPIKTMYTLSQVGTIVSIPTTVIKLAASTVTVKPTTIIHQTDWLCCQIQINDYRNQYQYDYRYGVDPAHCVQNSHADLHCADISLSNSPTLKSLQQLETGPSPVTFSRASG